MVDTPVRNKEFFGREVILAELKKWLLSEDLDNPAFSAQPRRQRHVVLCGIGGIGKTSIAMEFAFAYGPRFDAVFWIRADEPAKLEAGMSIEKL
jgi:Holliday junction resolvasome RuvABC ATP-dependent DNA helicase subunit